VIGDDANVRAISAPRRSDGATVGATDTAINDGRLGGAAAGLYGHTQSTWSCVTGERVGIRDTVFPSSNRTSRSSHHATTLARSMQADNAGGDSAMTSPAYKDYYQLLGVTTTASPKEIRSAYRDLARTYHPDVNPGNKEAAARFQEIHEAYAVLADPQKRGAYDARGSAGTKRPQQGHPPGTGRHTPTSTGTPGAASGADSAVHRTPRGRPPRVDPVLDLGVVRISIARKGMEEKGYALQKQLAEAAEALRQRVAEARDELRKNVMEGLQSALKGGKGKQLGRAPSRRPPSGRPPSAKSR
jgi:curved DNA-binding protein CbpA